MAQDEPAGPNANQAQAIAGNTRLVAQMIAEQTGNDAPPDRAGVEFLDGFIDRQRGQEGRPVERLGEMFACYLGEAMIAVTGGRWIQDPEYGLGVELAPEVVAFPFSKAAKHFENGPGDSILSFFESMAAVAARKREDADWFRAVDGGTSSGSATG